MPDLSTTSDPASNFASDNSYRRDGQDEPLPELPPFPSPHPIPISRVVSEFDLNQKHPYPLPTTPSFLLPHSNYPELSIDEEEEEEESSGHLTLAVEPVPPSLLSPSFTPPATPGSSTPALLKEPKSIPVDSSEGVNGGVGLRRPQLVENLPKVNCVVGATIPT